MSNFIMDIHSSILDPSRFSILLMAIFLTAIAGMITGPMHGNANPFYWKVIEGVFGGIGKRLDRAEPPARSRDARLVCDDCGPWLFSFYRKFYAGPDPDNAGL